MNQIDASLLEELIAKNRPFKMKRLRDDYSKCPHRDFVSFSTRKSSLFISYDENGAEHFPIVPLLTIRVAMGAGPDDRLARDASLIRRT